MPKDLILSGVQPTGDLHLGNYLGAFKQWLELQQDNKCIYCVVDYHAMTIDYDPKSFRQQILNTVIDFLAIGVNPKKSIIFIQSYVPAHTELAWIFNTITPIAELQRMTQFKEKSYQHQKNVNAGIFDYPVLMAADILLYSPTLIPVGEDQAQHVELTRSIAKKFNAKFGDTFKEPKVKLTKGARIMSLSDPTKKMSKSLGPKHYVALSDDPTTIESKVKSAVTDSGSDIKSGSDKPALTNLLTIYSQLSQKSIDEIEKEFTGKGYADFKASLAKVITNFLKPFQKRRAEIANDKEYVDKVLTDGAAKANEMAEEKMTDVRKKVGIR